MKLSNIIIAFLIGFALCFILLRSCDGNTVTTPEIKGTLHDTLVKVQYDTIRLKPNEKTVYKNTVQQLIVRDTIINDVVVRDTIYKPIDTLKTLTFSKTLEDSVVSITGRGTVTGRIEDLSFDYTVKPIKVKKPSRWSVGITGGVDYKGQPNIVGGVNYRLFNL